MKYVFFGTPEFAARVLEKLIASGLAPAVVVCNPDRPVGRKQVLTAPPIKSLFLKPEARNLDGAVPVLQPEKLDDGFRFQVSGFRPDLFVIASYGKILPADVLAIPRLGTVVVHPSLLPKYRGATPIQSALLAGDATTGVSLLLADEKVDHGPVLAKREAHIVKRETYETLVQKLANLAGELLVETLPKYVAGEITLQSQDESQATFTKKFTTEDSYVLEADLKTALDGSNPEAARAIDRKIRALNPEPGVWSQINGLAIGHTQITGNKRVKLLDAEVVDGALKLTVIQIEGKNPQKLV